MLGGANQCWRGGEGIQTGGDGAVRGVAHEAVEEGPCWAKDPGWRAEGWLFNGDGGLGLVLFCYRGR